MASPTFANGFEEDPMFQKSHYMQDISEQMRVPKRIRATGGEYFDDMDHLAGHNGGSNHWNYQDKIDMTVPDRIVVMGQDQHMGTRSAPREITLDNSIINPKDADRVRVSTPPRQITLSEHHFPSASEEPEVGSPEDNDSQSLPSIDELRNGFGTGAGAQGVGGVGSGVYANGGGRLVPAQRPKKLYSGGDLSFNQSREATPLLGPEGMSPSEELQHLRRQVHKINRRMLTLELDNVQRQQREKIVYCVGVAYFFLKALLWLNRN